MIRKLSGLFQVIKRSVKRNNPCIDAVDLFHQHLGVEAGTSDPQILTEAARQHLRETFLTRKAALTGVNFAIAETGEFVVCTNEGNADM
ncbi:hypothetical protein TH53_20450, partial [Pedobacter lusitanus]